MERSRGAGGAGQAGRTKEQEYDEDIGCTTCWQECRAARPPPWGAASVRSARHRSWIGRPSGASSPGNGNGKGSRLGAGGGSEIIDVNFRTGSSWIVKELECKVGDARYFGKAGPRLYYQKEVWILVETGLHPGQLGAGAMEESCALWLLPLHCISLPNNSLARTRSECMLR